MGFWSKLFSSEIEYPPLDMSNPAARQLDSMMSDIEAIADQVQVPIEVIPADEKAFIFAGEPPKEFGVFWVDHGQVSNLKQMADEKGMTQEQMMKLSEHLKQAYIKSQYDQRFSADTPHKGKVTVTPSKSLLKDVESIIKQDV